MNRPRIVCLCGSTRFEQAWKDANRTETLAGKIVLSVGLLGHAEGIDMDGPVKAMLDELHLRKIDLADEVLILNVKQERCPTCKAWHEIHRIHTGRYTVPTCKCWTGSVMETIPVEMAPYIGASTRRELAYAQAHGKVVRFLETPQESVP